MSFNRIARIIVSCIVLALLGSCTTTSNGLFRIEPGAKFTKMLLGTIQYEAHGWGADLDGIFYNGLSFNIQNLDTKKDYLIQQTPNEKFFYISSIEPGKYRVTKAVYKTTDGASLTLTVRRFDFEVKEGVVNNLGIVNWLADKTNKNYAFNTLGKYDETRESFATAFPASGWLEMEWQNATVKY